MASLLRCVGANELHRRHDFWPVIVEALKVCDRSLEPCLHVLSQDSGFRHILLVSPARFEQHSLEHARLMCM